ncbi:hypothetical protein C8Q76DRAFT_800316 [Earliella scabrosa]|nr:hypothetical protein C8Q76DRAFT_800316 [Earliella scabrosa]
MTVFKGVPPEVQAKLADVPDFHKHARMFAHTVCSRMVLEEIELTRREKDGRPQARLTYTITVEEDMLNIAGTMHGGCAVYLIDLCSSVALKVLARAQDKPSFFVSQALNTTFHAPAPRGAKLEIVNTTVSLGARTASAVTDIWDMTNKRLCMTGVHNQMAPSQPLSKL